MTANERLGGGAGNGETGRREAGDGETGVGRR